jgi:hypothetical protein
MLKFLNDIDNNFYLYGDFRGIQSQVCHTASDNAEKHLGAICEKIGSINRKQAKIRDRGDELAHNCVAYAVKELPSMRLGLDTFGKHLSTVQDYRQAYVSFIFKGYLMQF